MNQNITLPQGLDRKQLRDKKIISAMSKIPRAEFVPAQLKERANEDCPLPIGYEQTISQPFIVALMIQEASVCNDSKVLEVGTGSGYQTAVLAYLGAEVYTVEIIPELAKQAKETLNRVGLDKSIRYRQADGSLGWPEAAPFDSIIVSAACRKIPTELCNQLRPFGKLVLPLVMEDGETQELVVVTKKQNGYREKRLGVVRFVPLTHGVERAQ